MNELGPYRYRIERDEAVVAARHALRTRLMKLPASLLLIAIAICAPLLLVLDLLDGDLGTDTILVLFVAIPLVALFMVWTVTAMAKRQYAQSAALRDEVRLFLADDSLRFESARGTTSLPFAEFHALGETQGLFILMHTEAFYNLVPKRALDAAGVERLREGMHAGGVRRI